MKRIVVTLAVVCLVTAAQAAVTINVVNNGAPATGLTSYTVQVVADTLPEASTAFDGNFEGNMNQVKELGMIDTPSETRAVGPMTAVEEASDSHFLFLLTELTIVNTPAEDANTLAGDDGVLPATTVNAVFGIKPASVLQTLDLAQIVIADGQPAVLLNGVLSDGSGHKTTLVNIPIPEPASALLLALGGVVALIRRRR